MLKPERRGRTALPPPRERWYPCEMYLAVIREMVVVAPDL